MGTPGLSVTAMNLLLESAPTAAGDSDDISVTTLRAPTDQEAGMVSVTVASALLRASRAFRFSLPAGLLEDDDLGTEPARASSANGQPLPAWLRFDAGSRTFIAASVPAGVLPLQIRVSRGQRGAAPSFSAYNYTQGLPQQALNVEMELFFLLLVIAIAAQALKARDQSRRIALLGNHLVKHQIEKQMESLTEGYLRALETDDPERRSQIWNLLSSTETSLSEQFNRFVADFSRLDAADTRVSKLAFAFPHADKLFPAATFDLRKALSIHAQGIERAMQNSQGQSPKNKAFTLSAELFLMQHTCHWFCRSKAVASARLLVRHKTPYAQLLASVAPETRQAYSALVGN